ncbi:MAG TPA: phosphate signaling complex protein PhoU [Acidimicrobiales bacterium]
MTEIRRDFHQQLDDVQRDMVRVAARVIDSIMRGTHALLDHDLVTAQAVIDGDDEIDALTIELEERLFMMLALQQPVARDLRSIVAAIRLTSEIERSGDLMVNVAKSTRRLYGADIPAPLRVLLLAMAEEATRLFGLAMDSYADGNAALGNALDDLDDRLDQLHREYIKTIVQLDANEIDIQMIVQLGLVGRYYERIGDHAVNIGERVGYIVTGWMPENTGAARVAARGRHPDPNAGTDRPAPSDDDQPAAEPPEPAP